MIAVGAFVGSAVARVDSVALAGLAGDRNKSITSWLVAGGSIASGELPPRTSKRFLPRCCRLQ
jgi:hypothetical protein